MAKTEKLSLYYNFISRWTIIFIICSHFIFILKKYKATTLRKGFSDKISTLVIHENVKKCFYLRVKSSGWAFLRDYFHASNIFHLLGNCQVMNIYRTFTSFSCKINYEGFYGLKISLCVSPNCILLKKGVMANCSHNLRRPKSEFHLWNH